MGEAERETGRKSERERGREGKVEGGCYLPPIQTTITLPLVWLVIVTSYKQQT